MQILKQVTFILAAVLLSALPGWGQGIGVHYSPIYFPDADEVTLVDEYDSEGYSSTNYDDEETSYQEEEDVDQPALLPRTVVHYQPVWIVAFRPWWLTFNFYPVHPRHHRIYFSLYDWIFAWHGRYTLAWEWDWALHWNPVLSWGWAHRHDPWHDFFRPSHRYFRPWHADRYAWHPGYQPHPPRRPGHDFQRQDRPAKERPREKYLTDRTNERRREQWRTVPNARQEQRILPRRSQRTDSREALDQTRFRENQPLQHSKEQPQAKKQDSVRRQVERRQAPRSEMRQPANPSHSTRSKPSPSRRQETRWSDRQNRRSEASAGMKKQADSRQQERINRTAPSRREQKQHVAYTPRSDTRPSVSRNQAVDRRPQQERASAARQNQDGHRRR